MEDDGGRTNEDPARWDLGSCSRVELSRQMHSGLLQQMIKHSL